MTHQLIARTDDTTMDEQFGKHLQVLSLILINIELIHDAMLFGAVRMKIINVYFVLKQCAVNHLLFLMLIDFYLISSTTSNN